MGKGPVPADPGRDEPRLDWEPVITCPDPMSAEEWQAQLECEPAEDTDPQAYPDLALLADRAAGDDDSYRGASDDELAGVLCAWDRLESHMAARKLAAAAELSRRRPVTELPSSGRPAGSGEEDFTADELAHALAILSSGRRLRAFSVSNSQGA